MFDIHEQYLYKTAFHNYIHNMISTKKSKHFEETKTESMLILTGVMYDWMKEMRHLFSIFCSFFNEKSLSCKFSLTY